MSVWIDFTVYAALMLTVWVGAPIVAARFAIPMVRDRNPEWLAAHPDAAIALTNNRRFLWSCYALGMLSFAALVLLALGTWRPSPLIEREFEQWKALWSISTGAAIVAVAYCLGCGVIFARWLKREVPPADRRHATLERRSIQSYVSRGVQVAIYAAVALHLLAWLVVGILGRYSTPAFWGMLAFQFIVSGIVFAFARAAVARPPGTADRILGPTFRGIEVRAVFAAQLLPLMNGAARLYEEVNGHMPADGDRILHLGLIAVVVVAFVRLVLAPTARATPPTASTSARALVIGVALVCGSAWLWAQGPALVTTTPSDEEIRKILVERIDTQHQDVGLVVGVIEPAGQRVIAYGRRAKGDTRALDGNTVFELASVTKAFTSLLLADAVQRGEVSLTDPVTKYLPATVKMPERNGRAITLQDLATHTSGLPREPTNLQPKDPSNPFADYSVEQLYQFLSSYQLTRDIGVEFDYSNVGAGLLGHVLARRAGIDYGSLVRSRIAQPLGMKDTGTVLTADMRVRLAVGHNRYLDPASNWDSPTLAGAGALRSTSNDMLAFLAAALGYRPSPLAPAFALMTANRRPTGSPVFAIGLGWGILTQGGTEIMWTNGRSGGYRTWLGYEPRTRRGVVVLANADSAAGPDDIGRHLLNPVFPLLRNFPPPLTPRIETKVTPETFDRFVGRYQLAPAVLLTIMRAGNRFYSQFTGEPPFELFAESEKDYFLKSADMQLSFEMTDAGKAAAVGIRLNGVPQRALRIEGAPVVPTEILLDSSVIDQYVGQYQFTPSVRLTISRRDPRVFAQLSGQPPAEVFASSQREFFYKVANVQLTFEVDAGGRVTAVVLRQNGLDQRGTRVD